MAEAPKGRDSSGSVHTFICSYPGCHVTFSRNDRLIIHMRTHTGEKPFVCEEFGCGKSYARAAHLKRHVATSHCEAKQQDKLKCTVEGCKQDFVNNLSLSRHIERIHQPKEYKCQYQGCVRTFKKHHQLKSHETEHTHVNPYLCVVANCGKAFKTASHLQRHQKVHEGYVCSVKDCGMRFDKWTQLWKHRTVAHRQDFVCDKCEKRFTQQCRLSQHLHTHEDTREVFECPREDCSRVYLELRNLKAHLRSYHDGQRHVCPVEDCQRTFASKQKLHQHSRLHDAERPPPKKKSRKGQKKKSTALKLAMLGLGEGDSAELIKLDREKMQTNRCADEEGGDKSGGRAVTGIQPDRQGAEGLLIPCMNPVSPTGANKADSHVTSVVYEGKFSDDQIVGVTSQTRGKLQTGSLSLSRQEEGGCGRNEGGTSPWGSRKQEESGYEFIVTMTEPVFEHVGHQNRENLNALTTADCCTQTKVCVAANCDMNSEQCLMETKNSAVIQVFCHDNKNCVEHGEILRGEGCGNRADPSDSVSENQGDPGAEHTCPVPLSEHIKMPNTSSCKNTHLSDSFPSGNCGQKESSELN